MIAPTNLVLRSLGMRSECLEQAMRILGDVQEYYKNWFGDKVEARANGKVFILSIE